MVIDKKLVSACYDDWAKNYDSDSIDNAAIGIDRPIILALLANKLNKNSVGLDLGCGTGLLLKNIAPEIKEITGVDLSEKMIEKARENLKNFENVNLERNDNIAELKNKKTSSFDFVISSLAVCHIDELKVLFAEIHRVLAPGGVFIFDDIISKLNKPFSPKHFDYLGKFAQKGQIWQRRTKEDYIELLQSIDFEILETRETTIDDKAEKFLTKEDYENNKNCVFTVIFKARKC